MTSTTLLQKDINEKVFNFSLTARSIKKVQISPKQLNDNKFALTESFIKNQDSKYTTYGKGYRKPIIALAAFENNDRFCSTALLSEILGISSRTCDNNMRIISDYISYSIFDICQFLVRFFYFYNFIFQWYFAFGFI